LKKISILLLTFVVLLLTACSSGTKNSIDSTISSPSIGSKAGYKSKIIVGGKPFTEQLLLVQIMAQLLSNKTNHEIEVKEGLGSSQVLLQALKDDNIQLFADYTGTGYINILKNALKSDDSPETIYNKTKEGYEKQFGFTWLKPIQYSNTFTLIMKSEKAKKLNVITFSELVKAAPELVLGSDAQFFERADGFKGLQEKYGFKFKNHKEMDIGIAYKAIFEDQIDVLVGYGTDGRIPSYNLTILKDDKGYFPPYFPAPILKMEFLKNNPEVGEVLNLLADKLDEKTMAELNAKVDVDKKEPKDVAKEFLTKSGLIK
jgi:osmoprotectant transport system substrate-binding protein